MEYYHRNAIPYAVVGNMSNILPPDGNLEKDVVSTKKFREMYFNDRELYVSAGTNVGALLRACEEKGMSGLEFLVGIPCTVGGAVYMNAGVPDGYMQDRVSAVKVWQNGKTFFLNVHDCQYANKHSIFMQDDFLILGAKFCLDTASPEFVRAKKEEYLEKRKHLPKGKSMGCVFKNPQNKLAGKLIEGAGLKGLRVGGAKVSEQHANFIINDGCATSSHIRELINIIKRAVKNQYGVCLEEEIRYLD